MGEVRGLDGFGDALPVEIDQICMQIAANHAGMGSPTLTIRNLPEDVLATIRSRAQRSGESMQTYLWKRLVADASRPTPAEIVERAKLRLSLLMCRPSWTTGKRDSHSVAFGSGLTCGQPVPTHGLSSQSCYLMSRWRRSILGRPDRRKCMLFSHV